jgi:hypothetical protein
LLFYIFNFVLFPFKIPERDLPRLVESDLVPWPIDFIPTVKDLKPTINDQTPMEDRFKHVASLDRRMGADRSTSYPSIPFSLFPARLKLLRKGTVAWGSAKVEDFFLSKMNSNTGPTNNDVKDGLKDLMSFGGGKITSLTEFTAWIKCKPLDSKMRAVIKYGMYDIWGSGNLWAIDMEREFTRMLGITWLPHRANGSMQQRISKGRCAAHLFVKSKGSLVGTIRSAQKSAHSSFVLVREPKKKIVGEAAPAITKGKVAKKIPREVQCETTVQCDSDTNVAEAPATVVVPATNVMRATNVVPATDVVPTSVVPIGAVPIQVVVLESASTPSSSLTTPIPTPNNSAELQAKMNHLLCLYDSMKDQMKELLKEKQERLENEDASSPTGVPAKVSQMFRCNLYLLPAPQYFIENRSRRAWKMKMLLHHLKMSLPR